VTFPYGRKSQKNDLTLSPVAGSLKQNDFRFRPWPEVKNKMFIVSGHGRKSKTKRFSFPAMAGSQKQND
jgi:hypothetical protein